MRATETKLSEFLTKQQVQYSIPIYQRTYSWKEEQCKQLWDDIMYAGSGENVSAHFIGPIVYIKESAYHVSKLSELLVIDGQQRLTTAMLILEALARRIGSNEVEGFSEEMIRNLYLSNQYQRGENRYKMLLSKTDKESLKAIVDRKEENIDLSLHMDQNFAWFGDRIDSLDDDEMATLCKGLNKLTIVDITLERGNDKPQRIFESMNSTGLELSQADLIRNFVLMDLDKDEQNQLYEDHWRRMEIDFGQKGYEKYFDVFMRHYLTLQTRNIPNKRRVYKAFKEYADKQKNVSATELVADVHKFAEYYCSMELGRERNEMLAKAFHDLRELKLDVAYPFLLYLYRSYKRGSLAGAAFAETVRIIESYIFRRAVCRLPSGGHNKIILTILNKYEKSENIATVREYLLGLRDNNRFPNDGEFEGEFVNHRYPDDKYWLYRLENNDRKEAITSVEYTGRKYTVEHIMPQNLSEEWRTSLGSEHERIHEECLYSPGNITLTGYNPDYGNRPFAYKRDTNGGFKRSPLKLNEGLGDAKAWNETAIKKRAERLAKMAIVVWPFPH